MHEGQWYHLGVGSVAKSSLSYVNNNRSYEIFEKLFYALLGQCRDITPERDFKFNNPLYSFDSSTVRLCLSVFNWAKYTKEKRALKIHTLLNNRTTIPELINISDGKKGDLTAIKEMDLDLNLKKGSILVFDRAYIDYDWWNKLEEKEISFVSRTKSNQNIFVLGQHKLQLEKDIISNEIVMFGDFEGMKKYNKKLRRIKYFDKDKKKNILI
jgi:transposase